MFYMYLLYTYFISVYFQPQPVVSVDTNLPGINTHKPQVPVKVTNMQLPYTQNWSSQLQINEDVLQGPRPL